MERIRHLRVMIAGRRPFVSLRWPGLPVLIIHSVAWGQDSAAWRPGPEVVFYIGARTPAGMIGAQLAVELLPLVIPSVAAGFGAAEGMNYSFGLESRLLRYGHLEMRALGAFTLTRGSEDEINATTTTSIGPGNMFKVGGTLRWRTRELHILLGGGYAWFNSMPSYTRTSSQGTVVVDATEMDPWFEPGPMFLVGLAIPLSED